jgi:pantoate--beta-alanine ligase
MKKVEIIRSPRGMSAVSKEFLRKGLSIGLVPTMGALHRGHLSLVERSTSENDRTVVSIFVNPSQFGPNEDLDEYPRDLDWDIRKLEGSNVDIVFVPSQDELYPDDYQTYVNVDKLTGTMCGAVRPDHFKGVTTVVTKLFNIVLPTRAYFGQKDYQQGTVVKKMAKDLDMDIDVVTCPIVREEDGLALSSRNNYLNKDERKASTVIHRSLKEVSKRLAEKDLTVDQAGIELKRLLSAEPMVREIQYASVYDPYTLEEIKDSGKREEVLLAVALYIGNTRLIDNMIEKI